MFVVEILGSPHLVLADAGADNGLSLRDPVQALHHIVRLNEFTVPIVIERMFLFQLGDVREPGRKILFESRGKTEQVLKAVPHVTDMRPGHHLHFADLTGIDIDVRDVFGVRREFRRITGNTIVEPGADCDQKIAIFDGVVRIGRAVHAEHVESE